MTLFIANTDQQRREMLAEGGISADDLFADVPPEARCGELNVPPGMGEQGAPTARTWLGATAHGTREAASTLEGRPGCARTGEGEREVRQCRASSQDGRRGLPYALNRELLQIHSLSDGST